jgi:DNA-binding response OmpR family regulator
MKKKVFYVEDEIFLAKIVSETLEGRGFEVIMESDGGKAIERFQESTPDICLLDVMLPNKDGFTIADEIREKDQQVPIIFLTARSGVNDVVNGFKMGGNDYIRKPFSMEELIVRIDNALKQGSREAVIQEDEVKLGEFLFNSRRQTLTVGGDTRKLSFRESELLKILYLNRDVIVERREILNLLWGNDSFFNSRNLDVYITKLRNFLKQDPNIQIITIKGIGYRFVSN